MNGVVKQHMEKAYNRIEWDFLIEVMERMGLHRTWIQWIKECNLHDLISSAYQRQENDKNPTNTGTAAKRPIVTTLVYHGSRCPHETDLKDVRMRQI